MESPQFPPQRRPGELRYPRKLALILSDTKLSTLRRRIQFFALGAPVACGFRGMEIKDSRTIVANHWGRLGAVLPNKARIPGTVSSITVADHGRRTLEKLIDHTVSRNRSLFN